MNASQRPVLRYFGGKWMLAPWIISHFPSHKIYVEPFGGAASVLMRKPRSYAEVYNDLDGDVVCLFRILRDPALANELERRLRLTPFARDEFDESYNPSDDEIERCRKMIIRSYQGFGSNGHSLSAGKTGFRALTRDTGASPAHDWVNYPDQISNFCERLSGVVIENKDACEVMANNDAPDTLHFVDPPYVFDSRGTKNKSRYQKEMTDADHERLIDELLKLSGMVIICGYQHEIYDRLGWKTVTREAMADGARSRTEVLWLNPRAWDGQAQLSMNLEFPA